MATDEVELWMRDSVGWSAEKARLHTRAEGSGVEEHEREHQDNEDDVDGIAYHTGRDRCADPEYALAD